MDELREAAEDIEPSSPKPVASAEPLDAEGLRALHASLAPGENILDRIEPATDPHEIGLPKILGHQLTLKEWNVFEAYVRCASQKKAAAEAGVSVDTVKYYRKSAWWAELFDIYVKERQQDLHASLLGLSEDAVDATRRVLNGELAYDVDGNGEARYATAMMNAVQLLTKIGKAPLQDNRSITNIDNRSLVNTGTVHITRDKLATLDQDDMLRMITGEVKIEQEP